MQNVIAPVQPKKDRTNLIINTVSIAVPVVVAVLLALPTKVDLGAWTKLLPHVIGTVNTLTTLALIAGVVAIWQKKISFHQTAMTTAFVLGGLFLVAYVTYHLTNTSVRYGGEGLLRYVYLFVLLTHIALSLVVLPLVLRAISFAMTGQFAKHKSVVRYAYPIWLYVSVTGVIVYLMAHVFQQSST